MAFSTCLLFLFTLISFNSVTTTVQQQPAQPPAPPPPSLMNAVETLSNAHYNAMALTLEVLLLNQPQSLIPFPNTPLSLTIFSPPDSAFISSGQPSLSLLLLHFSPLSFSKTALFSLPYYSAIPTLSPSHTPLYITTTPPSTSSNSSSEISINGVKYSPLPLFDDGFVVVYGIDDFFNPNFTFLHPTTNPDYSNPPDCNMEFTTTSSRFLEPSSVLKSRGFSIMGSFLDLQLIGFMGSSADTKLTVFAPIDEALVEYSGNFLEYSSLFLRHLLPCKISWSDLNGIANGTTFDQAYLQGQGYNNSIKIQKLEDYTVMVNGVKITAPDMYKNESIVIHGLQQLIPVMDTVMEEEQEQEQISLVKLLKKPVNNMCLPPNNGEF